jgi:thiamine biosynthesis lipoprotein
MSVWIRRARPLLGTLVEVGLRGDAIPATAAFEAAFAAVAQVQAALSRFDPASEVSRFHRLRGGERIRVGRDAQVVLRAATALQVATDGLFDVTLGSAPHGWRLDGAWLVKLDAATRLDLGGIAKGHAVDAAVQALQARGCDAGWVNAGGDLRAFGPAQVPIVLRDEARGGAQPFAMLADGSFATSRFGAPGGARLAAQPRHMAHASVAAPQCLWADALTKVVAASGDVAHPALARARAQAWLH